MRNHALCRALLIVMKEVVSVDVDITKERKETPKGGSPVKSVVLEAESRMFLD